MASYHMTLLPPEADGEANRQRSDIMPTFWRNIEHIARLQYALSVWGVLKLWELLQVWVLHIHLAGVRKQAIMWIDTWCEALLIQSYILGADHLRQKVVLWVLMERGHRSQRSEPCVCVDVVTLPDTAVCGHTDVPLQLRHLVKQLVLC